MNRASRLPVLDSPRFLLTEQEEGALAAFEPPGFRHLPVELFRTERARYAFDVKKTRFLRVDEPAFEILRLLRERDLDLPALQAALPHLDPARVASALRVVQGLQAKGWLTPYPFRRAAQFEDHEYEPMLTRRLAGFTVFVTTECNLGCSYCIYGGQYASHEKLTQKPMSRETLRATMDFLRAHSAESEVVRLDFFGGEPLLAWKTIEDGVRHLASTLPEDGPQLVVTVTSNGTVLSEPLLDFLLEFGVHLQISLDGDQETHDRDRPFLGSGRGSWDAILRNLERIEARDPEYLRTRVHMKGVVTTASLRRADDAFLRHPLIRPIVDAGRFLLVDEEPHFDLALDDDWFVRLGLLEERLLELEGLQSLPELEAALTFRERMVFQDTFGLFFEVQAAESLHRRGLDAVPFAKGCLTGYQEGAVKPDGDIAICLKTGKGDNFVIGNVHEGRWYLDRIRELNRRFHDDWPGCASCFVQRFCDLCYEKLDGRVGEYVRGRAAFCAFNRERHRRIFSGMLRVLESNPALWEEIGRSVEAQRPRCTGAD